MAESRRSLVLHIGPHKTGTTAIQKALLAHARRLARSGSVVYPTPSGMGPGHSRFAEVLSDSVPKACEWVETQWATRHRRTNALLLSSENLIRVPSDHLSEFALGVRRLGFSEVRVVATLTPFRARAYSVWAERVKHGWPMEFEASIPQLLASDALAPGSVERCVTALNPEAVGLVVHDTRMPTPSLGDWFLAAAHLPAIGLRLPPDVNKTPSWVTLEQIRSMNEQFARLGVDPGQRRSAARALLAALSASPEWREVVDAVGLLPPWPSVDCREALDDGARQQAASLRRLVDAFHATVVGDLDLISSPLPRSRFAT